MFVFPHHPNPISVWILTIDEGLCGLHVCSWEYLLNLCVPYPSISSCAKGEYKNKHFSGLFTVVQLWTAKGTFPPLCSRLIFRPGNSTCILFMLECCRFQRLCLFMPWNFYIKWKLPPVAPWTINAYWFACMLWSVLLGQLSGRAWPCVSPITVTVNRPWILFKFSVKTRPPQNGRWWCSRFLSLQSCVLSLEKPWIVITYLWPPHLCYRTLTPTLLVIKTLYLLDYS